MFICLASRVAGGATYSEAMAEPNARPAVRSRRVYDADHVDAYIASLHAHIAKLTEQLAAYEQPTQPQPAYEPPAYESPTYHQPVEQSTEWAANPAPPTTDLSTRTADPFVPGEPVPVAPESVPEPPPAPATYAPGTYAAPPPPLPHDAIPWEAPPPEGPPVIPASGRGWMPRPGNPRRSIFRR